jgi:hypothetical protein
MRLRRWILLASTTVGLCLVTPAQGAGTLDKIKASRTISLGYREASIPFSYTGNDNQPWGYSVDLCTKVVAAVVRQLGIEELQLLWVPVTPETRVAKVKSGEIDLECGSTTSSLSRMQEVDFSLPIFVDGASYLSRRALGIKRFDDLAGRKIAVAVGTTTERTLLEALAQRRVVAELGQGERPSGGDCSHAEGPGRRLRLGSGAVDRSRPRLRQPDRLGDRSRDFFVRAVRLDDAPQRCGFSSGRESRVGASRA